MEEKTDKIVYVQYTNSKCVAMQVKWNVDFFFAITNYKIKRLNSI